MRLATVRIIAVSHLEKIAIWATSGVVSVSTVESRPLIRPISVAPAMAVTTPVPWPLVTSVPPNAMQLRSPRGTSCWMAAVCFSTGSDSPVRMASWICKPWALISRKSAGTLSPGSSNTISPGTSCSAGIVCRPPSRNTEAFGDNIRLMASMAFSAFPS